MGMYSLHVPSIFTLPLESFGLMTYCITDSMPIILDISPPGPQVLYSPHALQQA